MLPSPDSGRRPHSGPPPRPLPHRLVLVRHAESLGNVADRHAREHHAERLELLARDADVELSDIGTVQARALARHLREHEPYPPTVAISSPFRRALSTAETSLEGLAAEAPALLVDERLRERDLGAFDGLTGDGIRAAYPDEAQRRQRVGKLYYRPPGGESWCDVVLRVRSLLLTIAAEHPDQTVWAFTHQAVIMSFRIALERLDEAQALDLDRSAPLPNCSLTTYARDAERLVLLGFADTTAVDRADAPVTAEPESAGRGDDAGRP